MKNKLQNIYENYIKDYINELKMYYQKFKKCIGVKISNFSYKKSTLVAITSLGIFLFASIIFSIIKPSYSIFQNQNEFSILNGIVGNNEYDYTLLIYIEDISDNGKYILTENIPLYGYTYSGYYCKNNTKLIYNESTKYTKIDLTKKDICSIYFDYTNINDITIQIMLEDTVNSGNYFTSKQIPYYGYKYSYYECDNNSNLIYESNLHIINISSKNKDVCKMYFTKENSDIEVNLYIEEDFDTRKYIETNTIPMGKIYEINNDKTECLNNNERIETKVSYIDGYIDVVSNEVTYCKVYLKLKNE